MKNKPSASDRRWTTPTSTLSHSRAVSGDRKEKWAVRLEGEWGSTVQGRKSRDLRDDGSTMVSEW
jgi:hypothetical protein